MARFSSIEHNLAVHATFDSHAAGSTPDNGGLRPTAAPGRSHGEDLNDMESLFPDHPNAPLRRGEHESLPVILLDRRRIIIAANRAGKRLFTLGRELSSYVTDPDHLWISAQWDRPPTSLAWVWSTVIVGDDRIRRAFEWQFFSSDAAHTAFAGLDDPASSPRVLGVGRTLPFDERVKVFGRAYRLSARELEVVRLLVEGYSNTNIAARLSIAENTVRAHARTIYSRMAVSGRIELMRMLMT